MFNCSSFNDVTVEKYSYRRGLCLSASSRADSNAKIMSAKMERQIKLKNESSGCTNVLRQLLRPVEVRPIVRPMNDFFFGEKWQRDQ